MAIENTKKYINAAIWQSLFASTERPYYDVAGKVYYNKLEAIVETDKLSKQTGIGPWFILRFNCFNNLSTVDFSSEPSLSYQELCVQRAQQLRDKYKYIRLWYSGGVDSHTALRSFYEANLPIDEIVTVRQDDIGKYHNFESTQVVKPNLAKIRAWFPTAKITELDYTIDLNNNDFDSDRFQSKLLRMVPGWHLIRNPSSAFDLDHTLLREFDNCSHCELVGEPKPRVIKKDNKWYTYILDSTIEGVLTLPGLELFHLSRDFPQLYIKQCHLLKHAYEKLMQGQPDYYSKTFDKNYEQKNIILQRHNEWDTQNISQRHNKWAKPVADKDQPVMIFAHDYFAVSSEFETQYKKFSAVFKKNIYDVYQNYFDAGQNWKHTKGMFSIFWCLDEHKSLTVDQLWPNGFGNY